MDRQYYFILPKILPSPKLSGQILIRVALMQRRVLHIRLAFASFGVFASIVYTVTNWLFLFDEARWSSFIALLRILWTDFDVVWKFASEYCIALFEVIPIESVFITSVFIFCILSACFVVVRLKDIRRVISSPVISNL